MGRLWLIFIPTIFSCLIASPSFACLNDTGVRAAEDEFRSRYESPSTNATSSDFPGTSAINPWGVAALAIGGGLIAGSSLTRFRRHKRGNA
jgi:hypothetical protein